MTCLSDAGEHNH